jgi:ABC-type uncharacterized transport system fused permease/ATPase subunit
MEGGLDAVRDWKNALSSSEMQCLAMARLFYHRPLLALLDECTGAIRSDLEEGMFEQAQSMGITLITVTHRPSLWKV